jgi:DNA repair protein SbcD/Mre11
LEFSKYIGQGKPVYHKEVMLVGLDKIRKYELPKYEKKFAEIDSLAMQHEGHRILVMHQGITEINKFAGEINSTDLPKNFSYYAMGHLHDKFQKKFTHLGGPLVYSGSIELTTSEGIKETRKGFFEVDISSKEANPSWIELNIRPQISIKTTQEDLSDTIDRILNKIRSIPKKPIVGLKIEGSNVDSELVQAQISRLISGTLYCSWKISQAQTDDSSVLFDKPAKLDDELFKLAVNSLKSEKLATFAIKELLPLLSSNQIENANQLVLENYERFRKEKLK